FPIDRNEWEEETTIRSDGGVPGVDRAQGPRRKVAQQNGQGPHAIVQMPRSKILHMGRGEPRSVDIEVEFRQGNKRKFLTRVGGMEEYGIDGTSWRGTFRTGLHAATAPSQILSGMGGDRLPGPPDQGDCGSVLVGEGGEPKAGRGTGDTMCRRSW
ncbi:hypothetical protein THAOC_24313, partial [Thalassiosira oceanica]